MHIYQRRVSAGKELAGMDKYEDDYLEHVFVAKTQGWILTFTEAGQVYFLPVLDVPEGSRASRGQSVFSLTAAGREDPVVAMLPVDDLSADRFLVFLSVGGVMKRSKLSEFGHPRVGGVKAAGLKEGDRMLDVAFSDGDCEVMLVTRQGRSIRFAETDLTVMGRTARGVKGIDLQKGDAVVGMLLIRREAWVLTVTEGGMGRRTEVGEFPLQKRGGRGTLATSQEDGVSLVAALEVLDSDEVMIVAAGGQVSRISVGDIPAQGRRTLGIRVVDLEKGDRVVEVTRAQGGASGGPPPAVVVTQDQDNGPAEGAGQLDFLRQEEVIDS